MGDRTGLEMIRTLQDDGVHRGIDVHMECTVIRLLKDGDRVSGAFGYDRERGRFRVFRARAVVLATGGIGRAFKITSNSWEYTGDGHALAYDAGAELMDMEFVQFHPTGMVWPPSVMGILVTEGVRGEGGVLQATGRPPLHVRRHPRELPQRRRRTTRRRGGATTQGDKNARRPPELLTRDHVARCIMREVREGRGSPHGGVFLDIAWIKEQVKDAEGHIKRKLPSMYHQFKTAGRHRHHQGADGGGAHHPLRDGRRAGGRGDADVRRARALRGGEVAAGLHGANRLGGNSLSDLLVFGKRAGEHAARYAKEQRRGQGRRRPGGAGGALGAGPFERGGSGDAGGPY